MKIPTTVDAPSQLLGKDMDEVAVTSILFMVGILGGQLVAAVNVPTSSSVVNPFVRELS